MSNFKTCHIIILQIASLAFLNYSAFAFVLSFTLNDNTRTIFGTFGRGFPVDMSDFFRSTTIKGL